MKKQLGGHALELALLRALRKTAGCQVHASEELDAVQKVDFEIRSVDGSPLALPAQVQITMRTGHYTKLRKYIKRRAGIRGVVSLYVEIASDALRDVAEIASTLISAAVELQSQPLEGGALLRGLRIGREIAYFNLLDRFEELRRERESPERQQQLLRGVAQDFCSEHFTIFGEDGMFHDTHYIDVDDGAFRKKLRESIGMDDVTYLVWYLPVGKFACDVRPRPEAERPAPSA